MREWRQETLWTMTANAASDYSTTGLPETADIVVIGGGFTGMTAALELARAGKRVVVLEQSLIGEGASGMNAGFVVPNFAKADPDAVRRKLPGAKAEALLQLVAEGGDAVFATIRQEQIACDGRQVGWLQPAYGTKAADMLRRRAETWQRLGRPVRFLSADEIEAETGMAIYQGGLLDESGGTIHPLNYLFGLAKAVTRCGGLIREQAAVQAVQKTGKGWQVGYAGGEIAADVVLLATNAFTDGIAASLGRTVVPLRVYQVATRPLSDTVVERIAPRRRPVGDTRLNLFTYRLDRDNRLISGGMAINPRGAPERVGKAVIDRLVHELRLEARPEIEIVWSGVAAMTPDFLPRIHEYGPGFIGGIGCNGRGIAMTGQLGRVLARAALGERAASLPVPLLSPRNLPFHRLTPLAASAGLAQARLSDWWHG
ncbi:glycine/D-amino acid oxidase-like deaminating enzyme [Rhizobium halophytocola]|uniref:Glycine/D-amino acid oxidase-like deaminating enzyme n=2 Tax=Rhizobium halophytocola TaxID=735519 RepID=A0ABS4DV65_9HYPH|nr:glycine/D-amino acid oxidase-like deaminating enzyme [Rhizobium halophytocola]